MPKSTNVKTVGTLRQKSGEGKEIPAVLTHTCGTGKVVYLAAGFDSAYYLYAYPYQRLVLRESVRHVAPAAAPVVIDAPMCVHSTVMRQNIKGDERLIVHLFSDLNTTAFHALANEDVPLREEVVPIHDIRVTFRPDYRLGRIHLEPGNIDLPVQQTRKTARRGGCAEGSTCTQWSSPNSSKKRNDRHLWLLC